MDQDTISPYTITPLIYQLFQVNSQKVRDRGRLKGCRKAMAEWMANKRITCIVCKRQLQVGDVVVKLGRKNKVHYPGCYSKVFIDSGEEES